MLRELALDYPTDGIELDLSAPPGGGPMALRPDQVTLTILRSKEGRHILMRSIAKNARRRRSTRQCSRSG